jgi:hypothetical protein
MLTPHSPEESPPQNILEVENQKEESTKKTDEDESKPESQNGDTKKAVKFAEEPSSSDSVSNETKKIIL